MVHASLFTGIGGFDLAASWLGWQNLFQVEINPVCQAILRNQFPESKILDDIKKFDGKEYCGAVDVISGGFPCQPFSLSGKRRGIEDDRYLWPEMLRIINEIRPTWVVGENVVGVTSMVQPGLSFSLASQTSLWDESNSFSIEQVYVIETICKDFERIGYSVQPIIIPAAAVGAWHRRSRIWFLAYTHSVRQKRGMLQFIGGQGILPKTFFARFTSFDLQQIEKDLLAESGFIGNYDGIPNKLVQDEIGFYGNSIVPQIAFHIFKEIETLENLNRHMPMIQDLI